MVGSGLLGLHLAFAIARPLRRSEAGAKPSAPDERCQYILDGATVYHLNFKIRDVKQHTWVTREACPFLEEFLRRLVDEWW